MKFLLLAKPSQSHIGTFFLNLENRQWLFRYSDQFIMSGDSVLKDFPDVSQSYGHEVCVKWLSSRMAYNMADGKGVKLAEYIVLHGGNTAEQLEIHSVQ